MALGIGSFFDLAAATEVSADTAPATTAIPWSQIGAKAGAHDQGNALAVIPTAEGARLRCVFQQLEGEATPEGLWLTSTVTNAVNDRFRIVATEVGRAAHFGCGGERARRRQRRRDRPISQHPTVNIRHPVVADRHCFIDCQSVRSPGRDLRRAASMDGVRQDFVGLGRPPGMGELVLRLDVAGQASSRRLLVRRWCWQTPGVRLPTAG